MSTHNIRFHGEIRKISTFFGEKSAISVAMVLSGPKVIKHFSCSSHLSMKFVLLINLKLLTIANSYLLNITEHEICPANKSQIINNCKFLLAKYI